MFGNRFSSSTSCLRWLHETEHGRPDPSLSYLFLKVATHPGFWLLAVDPRLSRRTFEAAEQSALSLWRGQSFLGRDTLTALIQWKVEPRT